VSQERWPVILSVAVLASLVAPQGARAEAVAELARVIVKFRRGSALAASRSSPREAASVRARSLGGRLGRSIEAGAAVSELTQVVFARGISPAELASRIAQEKDVEYAVVDERRRIVGSPNDSLYAEGAPARGPAAGQWYLRAPSGEIRSAIDVEAAWAVTAGDPRVVVAIVDTGVRYEHPDLLPDDAGGSLLPGYDMVSDVAMANDGDGRDADASDPGDWLTAADLSRPGSSLFRCGSPSASSWHGTQVAGIVGALANNGIGMAGTAPGVRVLPVRVLGKCGGHDSDIIAGMRWAAGLNVPDAPANPDPARVVNLSLGGQGLCSPAYQEAVDEIAGAGAVVVAAAGNSSGHGVAVPANCRGVVAVVGLRHVGTKVGFSSLGEEVSIGAPGGNCVNAERGAACLYPILTTTDSGQTGPAGSTYTDSFNTSVGTSFAAPLVAGVAALVLSVRPTLAAEDVRLLLQRTARPYPAPGSTGSGSTVVECTAPQSDLLGRPADQLECHCTTSTCGAGMLDAGAAVASAARR
jgi:serine protease